VPYPVAVALAAAAHGIAMEPMLVGMLNAFVANYSNLEYDLVAVNAVKCAYLEHNLALLCGVEAATA
jgi:hypothetical protein